MPASRIRRLPTHLANKIAAGEVVERPASVLKELLENALDAGATRITVVLQAGGRRLVRVTDDGCGMSPDDAVLAIERHATSKIADENDLDHLGTFGFRGEALPSIAAVSKFEMVTRPGDALAGTRVVVEGGEIQDVGEVGAPPGTTVSVRQLFYNVPARAKFLKSRETELSHCLTMVQQAALAHPGVAFRLDHNGRIALDLPASEDRLTRLGQIWGQDLGRTLRPIAASGAGFQLSGYIAGPDQTRANRSMQHVFVNDRPVSNPTIAHAISEAYQGRLMVGRYPVAFLFLAMDPAHVDVNVHPTKREVRFRRSQPIHDSVVRAIQETFGNLGHAAPARPGMPAPYEPGRVYPTEPGPPRPVPAPPHPVHTHAPTPWADTDLAGAPAPDVHIPPADGCDLGRPGGPAPAPRGELGPPLPLHADFGADIPPFTFLQQLFHTYLLCTCEDELVVIDQHALHERMVYEALVQRVADTDWRPQRLLLPRVLEFAPDHAEVLRANLELFENLGIEIEPFGDNAFAIVAVSQLHTDAYIEHLVRDSVDELRQGQALRAPREVLDRLLTISACKNAIKAGQPVSAAEAQMLLDGLRTLPKPPTCLHGRPLVLTISKQELDRRFGRLGTVH